MSRLELTLLGMPKINIDGQPVERLASRKARALLIYLAITGTQHERQTLAGLLWGDMTEENARRNLRVALTKLRPVLDPYLLVQRRSLSINPDSDIWLDTREFETCLQPSEPSLQQLHRAAKLYQGHFLDEFNLRDAPMFEDWIRPLQERYRKLAMEALYKLAVYHTQQKQYSTGIDYAGRLLTLEPWMEEAHRQMMFLQALSGQRSAALAQYEACHDILEDELGVEPSEATQKLYDQIINEEIGEDLAKTAVIITQTTRVAPFQVPAPLPHFVGRAKLVQQIATRLTATLHPEPGATDTQTRNIHALVGMGGVGKSALAIHVAHTVRDKFQDGVLWANVAASEPMAILESWAHMYGYDFTRIADVESMAASFRGVIADKSVLMVLDDVTGMARVRPLLPTGRNNQVIMTTRDQDLARALNAEVWPLVELSQENGRLLLTHILGEARVAAEPDEADTICSLLQNLPLAVEITAQRLKSRPRRRLADMAQRLRGEKQRLSWLKISDREVRASFAVSWETLDAAHQEVFALLGLFNGRSFTANAIAYMTSLDHYLAEDRLFALTALSLVAEDGMNRYRQHPLLADFAQEQLGDTAGKERFAAYYLHFAQTYRHDYDILRPEWDNIMIAMETAYIHQLWQTVIDYANALHDAWFARGRYSQARLGYRWAVSCAKNLQDPLVEAKMSLQYGRAALKQSDYDDATMSFEKCLTTFQEQGRSEEGADVLYELAEIANETGHFAQAIEFLNRCKAIREAANNRVGFADILYKLGDVQYGQGNSPEDDKKAENYFNQALDIYEAENEKNGVVKTLRKLSTIATTSHKDFDLAERYITKALALCTQINDKHEHAFLLENLSRIRLYSFLTIGSPTLEEAREFAERSLKQHQHIGDQRAQAQALWNLSRIDFYAEAYPSAEKNGQLARSLVKSIGDNAGIIFVEEHLGQILYKMGRPTDAYEIWHDAYHQAVSINHPLTQKLSENLQQFQA